MKKKKKKAIKEAHTKQWMVAKKLGISEYTLVRWLRDELSEERKKAIYAAIEALSCKGV